jgi:hypothetical protein
MAKAELKTKATGMNIPQFIAAIDHPVRCDDANTLLALYTEVTGLEPAMWGPSIIGYGSYHYTYASGREGDWMRAGFSPRKANLSVYLFSGYGNPDAQERIDTLRAQLGKHKMGASCLVINKLADVDMDILRQLIALDLSWMDAKYPR